MTHPPMEEFQELIRTQDKRPALRGLYKKYGVTSPVTRAAYNKLWDALRDAMPDAYVTPEKKWEPIGHRDKIEKAVAKARKRKKKSARKKRKTAENDGHCRPPAADAVQEEPAGIENEQGQTA